MKFVITFFLCVCAVVYAAPQGDSKDAIILNYESDNAGLDSYRFAFQTSDGVSRQEEGELKNVGQENEALSVKGSVTWIGADGQEYTLTYIADENGFQPSGAHLPQAVH